MDHGMWFEKKKRKKEKRKAKSAVKKNYKILFSGDAKFEYGAVKLFSTRPSVKVNS